ncbi:MAG: amidohydrolase [Prolixibacteraceae bacterium]
MNNLRISLIQFEVIWENPVANRLKIDELICPLYGQTDLILLPEMFTTGFSMHAKELAETMEGETVNWMLDQARTNNFALAGSLIIKENGQFFNRFLFVTPSGNIFHYDKRHLFSIGEEHLYFKSGDKRVFINFLGWRIMLLVCYDLRFPVWCHSIREADLLLFVANWPEPRNHVWQALTKARAIENQLYVAGVNRTGTDGSGISYLGESMIIDPKGRVLLDLGNKTETAGTCDLSLDELIRFREKFPVGRDADSFEIIL